MFFLIWKNEMVVNLAVFDSSEGRSWGRPLFQVDFRKVDRWMSLLEKTDPVCLQTQETVFHFSIFCSGFILIDSKERYVWVPQSFWIENKWGIAKSLRSRSAFISAFSHWNPKWNHNLTRISKCSISKNFLGSLSSNITYFVWVFDPNSICKCSPASFLLSSPGGMSCVGSTLTTFFGWSAKDV